MWTNVYNEDVPAVAERKGSEKDKKPILSTIFAKSKNFKPGIYTNKAYKWIPGYGIFIKLILHGKMAFDTIVTLWSRDQVVYGCGLSYILYIPETSIAHFTCHGQQNLPNQVIHLDAILLFAGFCGVVTTMW